MGIHKLRFPDLSLMVAIPALAGKAGSRHHFLDQMRPQNERLHGE